MTQPVPLERMAIGMSYQQNIDRERAAVDEGKIMSQFSHFSKGQLLADHGKTSTKTELKQIIDKSQRIHNVRILPKRHFRSPHD